MSTSTIKYECKVNGQWRLIHPTDLANPALLVRKVMPDGTYGKPMQLHELQDTMVDKAK